MDERLTSQIVDHLTFVYGAEAAGPTAVALLAKLADFRAAHPELSRETAVPRVSERDTILITYGDMVREPDKAPLHSLHHFLRRHVGGLISTVHLLPFYPYSSDDGFSVIDYRAVDPALGSWADVARLGSDYRLMFDAVINHISAESDWFQGFLHHEAPYRDFFTVVQPDVDLTAVFRPRALPLLHEVDTAVGPRHVWTTFSADQIDLNYASPDLLLAVIDTLLFYVAQGADFIRLDAIAFIWKEIGTNCLHRPQTHRLIQLLRIVLDAVAPRVALITETNVPHQDNIAYFGDGTNEAQMVYNFSLPPLTLHAFHTGQAETLARWAATLSTPSPQTTFFNFLASHDGIGLTPARGILSETAVTQMAARVQALGGYVSYRSNGDGTQSAYELNVNYLDALGDPAHPDEPPELAARRFLCAQAIMLALRGVPGIYFHSLFGSRNWRAGVAATGRYRTINREKLTLDRLNRELETEGGLRRLVFAGYRRLLAARTSHPAFHPMAAQEIVPVQEAVLAIRRGGGNGRAPLLCLHNVSRQPQTIQLGGLPAPQKDLITGEIFSGRKKTFAFTMRPYQVLWLVETQ
ncbi:MAG: DUF3459 domain-containing protein [Ardenticatenaceae bacterium]|nr:DUF3459 domain-containing protein [Ardenticatenaceae bacterium]MCB8986293.1 DUF3459 domain-containing protein [Ardenticatenaceae bacterium]